MRVCVASVTHHKSNKVQSSQETATELTEHPASLLPSILPSALLTNNHSESKAKFKFMKLVYIAPCDIESQRAREVHW